MNPETRAAYLVEYQECAESYRHTYQTIWQAGAIFIAASAAILGFGGTNGDLPDYLQVIAPLPFLFWWIGIFRPMNVYGEWRSTRLAEIERKLNEPSTPNLNMRHFKDYDEWRKSPAGRREMGRLRPGVHKVVDATGIVVMGTELVLVVSILT